MKLVAETTGAFMMHTPDPAYAIGYDRPYVVKDSPLLQSFVAAGKAKVLLRDLDDEAKDEDFAASLEETEDLQKSLDYMDASFSTEKKEPVVAVKKVSAKASSKKGK